MGTPMQVGLSVAAAAPDSSLTHAEYCAMHTALKAISEAPGAVSSAKLEALLSGELKKATILGGFPVGKGEVTLARELQDKLVKSNIITWDVSGHKFSSRGAKWYFEEQCAAPTAEAVVNESKPAAAPAVVARLWRHKL